MKYFVILYIIALLCSAKEDTYLALLMHRHTFYSLSIALSCAQFSGKASKLVLTFIHTWALSTQSMKFAIPVA